MNHTFTTREKILLLLLALVAVGMIYYRFTYSYFQGQKMTYDPTVFQDEMTLEQAKAASLKNMREAIENADIESTGEIAVYNNQTNEILAINEILTGKCTGISLNWNAPVLDETFVRRVVSIDCRTDSYDKVRQILTSLSECRYKLVINDIKLDSADSIAESGEISVGISVTFFETITGAESTEGLNLQ